MQRRIVPILAALALVLLVYEALAADILEGLDLPPRYVVAGVLGAIAVVWALVTLLRGRGGG